MVRPIYDTSFSSRHGKQEFVQSLKTKDFQEAKLLKYKYLDRYAQMISIAKRQLGSIRSKEDQLINCGLMLRQFNEQEPLTDDSWNTDVLESKLEELWGPEVAHSVLNGHHHDYKGTQVPIGSVEALKDAYKASDPDNALLSNEGQVHRGPKEVTQRVHMFQKTHESREIHRMVWK